MAIIESLPCSQKALSCSQEAEVFYEKNDIKEVVILEFGYCEGC